MQLKAFVVSWKEWQMKFLTNIIFINMKKNLTYFLVAAVIILAALLFKECSRANTSENNTETLIDSLTIYKNKYGEQVAEKRSIIGSKKDLENLLLEYADSIEQLKHTISGFKSVTGAGIIQTVFQVDTLKVPYEVNAPCNFNLSGKVSEPYYKFNYLSLNDSFNIYNIEIPNTLTFSLGSKKTGLFKTEERLEVINSNPYIKVTGMDSYIKTTRYKPFGLGVFVGVDYLGRPTVGAGVNVDVIRF